MIDNVLAVSKEIEKVYPISKLTGIVRGKPFRIVKLKDTSNGIVGKIEIHNW